MRVVVVEGRTLPSSNNILTSGRRAGSLLKLYQHFKTNRLFFPSFFLFFFSFFVVVVVVVVVAVVAAVLFLFDQLHNYPSHVNSKNDVQERGVPPDLEKKLLLAL